MPKYSTAELCVRFDKFLGENRDIAARLSQETRDTADKLSKETRDTADRLSKENREITAELTQTNETQHAEILEAVNSLRTVQAAQLEAVETLKQRTKTLEDNSWHALMAVFLAVLGGLFAWLRK